MNKLILFFSFEFWFLNGHKCVLNGFYILFCNRLGESLCMAFAVNFGWYVDLFWAVKIGFHVWVVFLFLDEKKNPFWKRLVSFGDSAKVFRSSLEGFRRCTSWILIDSLYPGRQPVLKSQHREERNCLKKTVFHRPWIVFGIYPVWLKQVVYCSFDFILFIYCYIDFVIYIVLCIICLF